MLPARYDDDDDDIYVYIYICIYICPEDLPRAMNDREEWRERVRDIRAASTI